MILTSAQGTWKKPRAHARESLSLSRCTLILSLAMSGLVFTTLSSWAVEVTASAEGSEQRFAFRGQAFPYVLRLWEAKKKQGEAEMVWGRGLGLRGPWWEDPHFSNAWYQNGFLEVALNKKNLLHDQDAMRDRPLFHRCEVLESGTRALVQYLWERESATVRLRFLMRPECRALLAELQVEPQQPLESLVVSLCCFPGAYTTKHEGDRRMRTALREEKSVAKTDTDPRRETWMLLCDQKLDMADPMNKRVGFDNNGCAGLYVLPEGIANLNVELTGYPINISINAKPGATRLRLAFDELPMTNAEAFKTMQETAPVVQKMLSEETFQPSALTGFSAATERERVLQLSANPRVSSQLAQDLSAMLDRAEKAVAALRSGSVKPVSDGESALAELVTYRRQLLTAQRRCDTKLHVFEMRGPGYSRYQFPRAVEALGPGAGDITGGYLFIGGQGRNVTPFPGTLDDLYRYDVFLMLDSDTRALAPQQLQLLRQYVEDGGGLALFGGLYGYGASDLKDTPLADLLPLKVEVAPFGLRQAAEQTLHVAKPVAFLKDIKWSNNLVSPWYHQLKLADGAQLLVREGCAPWLAVRSVGNGRVVACAGTLMGEAKPGRTRFFEWQSWPQVAGKMLRWLGQK